MTVEVNTMKLIESDVKIIEQQSGLDGVYKQIELAGRTCYKSEDKITEDSAKGFVKRMIESGHNAMLEHGTVYLRVPYNDVNYHFYLNKYEKNPYSRCTYGLTRNGDTVGDICITTNYRVLVEHGWLDDLKYQCEPTKSHKIRITARFICDRGVSHEFVRHRVFSFAQESTRYCNYSKDKFGNELTFIKPSWLDTVSNKDTYSHFLRSLEWTETNYMTLLHNGLHPQQARALLPNATKTELVMTGFLSDWKDFFILRSPKFFGAKGVHPDAAKLADQLYDIFVDKDFINGDGN